MDGKILAIALLACALLLFGCSGSQSQQQPAQQPAANQSLAQKEAATLLLSSFDRGAALSSYSLAYTDSQGNRSSSYEIISNSTDSYVSISNELGKYEAFFHANESQNQICFTNKESQTACTLVVKNESTEQNANNMKAYLISAKSYLDEKSQTQRLINYGVIRFTGPVADEQAGAFSTKKVQYTLSYGNLTVNQLSSIGISPSSPELAYTNQVITYWFDRQTGLLVKGKISYSDAGQDVSFQREFTRIQAGSATLQQPAAPLSTKAQFFNFVSKAEKDYTEMAACASKQGAEQDTCYKTAAVNNNDASICTKISNTTAAEQCVVAAAQATADASLCALLPSLSDDCYIAVAGENGDSNLCKSLKNTSLGSDCIAAAASGKQKQDELEQQKQQQENAHNCALGADCETAGNANQYCIPRNSNLTLPINNFSTYACLKDVPCGCNAGFCAFAKNETYYSCVDAVEDKEFKAYIEALAHPANATNETGGANSSG
ncbi:Uncharacterised protein [uncultured archaeon]|nr:Uncharacterised protein [uncultured archaeon]